MFVRERMTTNPVTVPPDMPVMEAMDLMRRNSIRRLPVVQQGRLEGIVTFSDLLKVSPSPATSLSIYEVHYLVAKMKVKEAMTKKVITVSPDAPIEEAALLMRDHKVGGLPVVDLQGKLVGIITETDLFETFIEMMGLRRAGARITLELEDRVGVLADVTRLVKDVGVSIISLATTGLRGGKGEVVLRVSTSDPRPLVEKLQENGFRVRHVA